MPWPGMYAPLVSTIRVKSSFARWSWTSFASELAFHERVRCYLPDVASPKAILSRHREIEQELHERHAQRVLATTRAEPLPIRRVQRHVLRSDIRRIRNHHLITPIKDAMQRIRVLSRIDMR